MCVLAALAALSTARFAAAADHPSDEAALALLGTRVLVGNGMLRDPDAPRVEPAMRAAYEKMRADEDDATSPLVHRTTPLANDAPDLLVYEPRGSKRDLAVIFLHGYGGRFALPCWQIARVAAQAGATTACPDAGADGDWWTAAKGRIVDDTVRALRESGARRIVLVGLSNGGIGAAHIAAQRRGTFAGLVLVSGADTSAGGAGVPTLVLQGRRDTMFGADVARAYANATHARYVDLPSGHFAMMLDASVVDAAFATFLRGLRASETRPLSAGDARP
jgi:pimeloyl-ACP methyl ester carboxylesterase